MITTLSIQADFSNYFQMIQTDAVASVFYTDITKHFNEGKIDAATYAKIITSFHQSTLQEGLSTAKSMSLGVRELELKANESAKKVEVEEARRLLLERQKDGFDENLLIKTAEITGNQIGMIESGGLNAPQNLWDISLCASNELQYITRKHYNSDNDYPTCTPTPPPANED